MVTASSPMEVMPDQLRILSLVKKPSGLTFSATACCFWRSSSTWSTSPILSAFSRLTTCRPRKSLTFIPASFYRAHKGQGPCRLRHCSTVSSAPEYRQFPFAPRACATRPYPVLTGKGARGRQDVGWSDKAALPRHIDRRWHHHVGSWWRNQ